MLSPAADVGGFAAALQVELGGNAQQPPRDGGAGERGGREEGGEGRKEGGDAGDETGEDGGTKKGGE